MNQNVMDQRCPNCGVAVQAHANFCYQCGFNLKAEAPAKQSAQLTFIPLDDLDGLAAISEPEEESATVPLQQQTARLLHLQTGTAIELPTNLTVIHIGKPNSKVPPEINVKNLPNAEVVSRIHAQIRLTRNLFQIEDLESTNGTYINDMLLPPNIHHNLRLGDRIGLGSRDQFTFLFLTGLPFNMSHLNHLSKGDVKFERELIQSYLGQAQTMLHSIAAALEQRDMTTLEEQIYHLKAASAKVGSQLVQLLAEQMESQVKQNLSENTAKLQAELERALAQAQAFAATY